MLVVDGTYSAALTTAINSSCVSGSGLACILLAFAALSATLGRSASVIPHVRTAGMLNSSESALTQSMPVLYACFTPARKHTRYGRIAFESRMLW